MNTTYDEDQQKEINEFYQSLPSDNWRNSIKRSEAIKPFNEEELLNISHDKKTNRDYCLVYFNYCDPENLVEKCIHELELTDDIPPFFPLATDEKANEPRLDYNESIMNLNYMAYDCLIPILRQEFIKGYDAGHWKANCYMCLVSYNSRAGVYDKHVKFRYHSTSVASLKEMKIQWGEMVDELHEDEVKRVDAFQTINAMKEELLLPVKEN